MTKVSFDFDNTLSRTDIDIQDYVKELISRNIEVYICTCRLTCERSTIRNANEDLFLISEKLGIKRENIIFTNFENKSEYLKDKDVKFHIDDMLAIKIYSSS